MAERYGIHWFRRDLRVAGNQALLKNFKRNKGRVVGVFCFDAKFLSRSDFSVNRFQFFLKTLESLQEELRAIGSDLLFLDVGPRDAFPKLINLLEEEGVGKPKLISWSRDYEPFARKRDAEMKELFDSLSIPTNTERDHLLIEPHELVKKDTTDGWYQVYSPFARKWLAIFEEDEIQKRLHQQNTALEYLKKHFDGKSKKIFDLNWKDLLGDNPYSENLQKYLKENGKRVSVPIPEAGSKAAYQSLVNFADRLDSYQDKRDFPGIEGTSQFSLFLKNGSLTVPLILAFFDFKVYKKKKSGRDSFFSELIWREFYYHILYHRPDAETQSFLPKYRDLKWQNNKEWFQRWKEGQTGFPIVDAGMRQLKQTGWMHNRVRMIVASFLIKDLLIDWRWGEKYFMETLLDGDLAPNNGGWQWAASTGCDAQPYFRIFNPWSQSKKFDAEAEYIKTYVPELRELTPKEIHQPIMNHPSYPEPMVEHSEQRELALELFKVT